MTRGTGPALPARARTLASLAVAAIYASLFLGALRAAPSIMELAPRLQFLSAAQRLVSDLMSGAFAAALGAALVLAAHVALTLCAGRLHCSFLCPFGALMDGLIFLGRFRPVRGKRKPALSRPWTHAIVAAASLAGAAGGLPLILGLLEPYSAFGKVISGIAQPLLGLVTNAAAYVARAAGSYAIPFHDMAADPVRALAAAIPLSLALVFALAKGRLYCNLLCPTGAILRFLSRRPMFGIRIREEACARCGDCAEACRASCIAGTEGGTILPSVDQARCVRCFDCIATCPSGAIRFGGEERRARAGRPRAAAGYREDNGTKKAGGISRRDFLSGAGSLGLVSILFAFGAAATRSARKPMVRMDGYERLPAAPPGAGRASRFLDLCTACGTCAAVCPSGVLRSSAAQWSVLDAGKPYLAYEVAYCQFECDLCLRSCPTGALLPIPLEVKKSSRLGTSKLERPKCIVIEKGTRCGACAEHCPTGAISMRVVTRLPEPFIDEEVCIGCGACETVCPAEPRTAIRVEGRAVQDRARTLTSRPGDSGDVQARQFPGASQEGGGQGQEGGDGTEGGTEGGEEGFPF